MKFLTLCAIVAVNCYQVTARGPANQYLPPSIGGVGGAGAGGGGLARSFANTLVGQSHYQSSSAAQRTSSQFTKQQTSAVLIPILRNDYQSDGYGNYNFGFETANGIRREENGVFENIGPEGSLNVQGSYSYTGDDGRVYSINYKADSNGFHAVGDHLPTPPSTLTGTGRQHQQQHGSFGGLSGVAGSSGGGLLRRQHQSSIGSFTTPNVNYLPPSVGALLSSSSSASALASSSDRSSGYNYDRHQ